MNYHYIVNMINMNLKLWKRSQSQKAAQISPPSEANVYQNYQKEDPVNYKKGKMKLFLTRMIPGGLQPWKVMRCFKISTWKILERLINHPFDYAELIFSGSNFYWQSWNASYDLYLEGAVLKVHKKNVIRLTGRNFTSSKDSFLNTTI